MRLFFTFILMAINIIAVNAKERDNGYKITSSTFDAVVNEDNVWKVTETINVTFLENRHGIYRYIPRRAVMNHKQNGTEAEYTYRSQIEDVEVDGFRFTQEGNDDSQDNLIIKIGDPDILLTGSKTFVIRYTISYPDDRFSGYDFINTTLLGTDWNTTIDRFSFRIKYSKNLPDNIKMRVYSGAWGSSGNSLDVNVIHTGNTISGQVSNIEPNNGITIYAELPEGFWENPMSIGKEGGMLFAGLTIAVFAVMIVMLIFKRRKRPMVVYEYAAPEGISSAEVGVIIDDSADLEDLNSLIVWFASKGYLKIRETNVKKHIIGKDDSDIELIKLRDLPKDAPKYQKEYFEVFFADTDTVSISDLGDKHEQLGKAISSLGKHFTKERKLTKPNIELIIGGLIYIILAVLTFGYSSAIERYEEGMMLFAIFLFAMPVIFAGIIRMLLSRYDMIKSCKWIITQMAVFAFIGAAIAGGFWLSYDNPNDLLIEAPVLISIIAGGWIIVMLSGRMFSDTDYRIDMMQRLLGFRDFIEKSELPMLKQQVDENPDYFFDVLPYAMVFGLSKKWQKQFKEIEIKQPDWYECDGSVSMNNLTGALVANRLVHNMNNSVNNAIAISSHDPSAGSSSSGGSFSGGGFGGGGGGSW